MSTLLGMNGFASSGGNGKLIHKCFAVALVEVKSRLVFLCSGVLVNARWQ